MKGGQGFRRAIGMAIAAALAVVLAAGAGAARAQVQVEDAWVRATVPGQMGTGLFGRIVSKQGGQLVAAESAAAGVAEIHEMALQDGVMKMRAVPALDLPAGRAVELKPGGYHVMLMDLRQTMTAGTTVPVMLIVRYADGRKEPVEVRAQVRPMTAGR
jgi:copper(I)-binding protein